MGLGAWVLAGSIPREHQSTRVGQLQQVLKWGFVIAFAADAASFVGQALGGAPVWDWERTAGRTLGIPAAVAAGVSVLLLPSLARAFRRERGDPLDGLQQERVRWRLIIHILCFGGVIALFYAEGLNRIFHGSQIALIERIVLNVDPGMQIDRLILILIILACAGALFGLLDLWEATGAGRVPKQDQKDSPEPYSHDPSSPRLS